jgi:hypothetical protein
MNLFLIHCGFYDTEVCDGVYESHICFFVAAKDKESAKIQAKNHPDYKKKRMHIDGLQEIIAVDGWRISLEKDLTLGDKTILTSHLHRELATKPANVNP